MRSRNFILWEVDVQRDFMLPGGALYVPGAEKLIPNIRLLTDAARRNEVFLVSSGDFHAPNDPEFQQFPAHCIKGTPGAELLPEALADKVGRVANRAGARFPPRFLYTRQSERAHELLAEAGVSGDEAADAATWGRRRASGQTREPRPSRTRPCSSSWRARSTPSRRSTRNIRGRSFSISSGRPGGR